MKKKIQVEENVKRLDAYLSKKFSDYSRSFFQKLIKNGFVQVNNNVIKKPDLKLKTGDILEIKFPEEKMVFDELKDEAVAEGKSVTLNAVRGLKKPNRFKNLDPSLSLRMRFLTSSTISDYIDIIYEDESILVINKPAGLCVHPAGKFSLEPTLVDFLKTKNYGLDRSGIVHRLDRDTSGIMVIAKTPQAQFSLMKQFQTRTVQKTYLGIVHGILSSKKGKISAQLTRDHKDRKKFCIGTGREAITEFKVIKTFNNYSLLEIYPRTGRTHQIRVHLSSIGHPILGDKLYGKKNDNSPRQMLHSYKLKLFHPKEKKEMEWKAKIPDDFLSIMKKLGVLFLVFCFSIVYTNATSNTTQTSSSISTEIKSIKSELKKLTKEVEKIDKISRKVSDLEKSLEEQNVNNQTRLKEINMAVAELNRKITNLEINFEEYKRTSALERIKQQDKESKDKLKPVEKTTSSEEIERISAIETEILLVKKEISMIREKIGITQTKLTQEEESTGNDKIIKFLKSPWAVATALGVSILALLIAVF